LKNTEPILFIPPVHWNYYPYRDQELPAAMAQRGYKCIYLNPVSYRGSEKAMRFRQVHQRKDHPDIQVINRNSPWRKSLLEFIREVVENIRAVRRFKPGAVISSDHLMSIGACIYCRCRNIPFIFDVTDNWELVDRSLAGKIYKFFLKPLLARYSYAITCTSLRQYTYFRKLRKRHTFLISNGINPILQEDLDHSQGGKDKPSRASVSKVNFIGSLRDWYDFDLLFEVFHEFPDIDLHIYGLGPLYAELQERSRSTSNVHVHGNIEPSLTAGLLEETLFGLLPLKINELNNSTCPIKLFDYWGASRAVISTPVEEVSRLGGDSILYAGTKEEFVKCMNRLINNEELRRKLGKEGKRKVDKTHNYKTITDQFLQILNTP
jgi:glycosyltransferase involved in cell wall biosynthesis